MVSREKYRGVLVRLSHSVLSLSHVHLSFNIYLSHPFVYVSLFLPFFFFFFFCSHFFGISTSHVSLFSRSSNNVLVLSMFCCRFSMSSLSSPRISLLSCCSNREKLHPDPSGFEEDCHLSMFKRSRVHESPRPTPSSENLREIQYVPASDFSLSCI